MSILTDLRHAIDCITSECDYCECGACDDCIDRARQAEDAAREVAERIAVDD